MKKIISFLILSVISLQIYAVSISDMKYRFRNRKGYSTVKTTFVLNDWDYKTEILKIETGVGVDININMSDTEHTKIGKNSIKYFVKDKAIKARRLFKYNLKTHKALLIIKDKNELPGDPSKLWVSTTNINSSSSNKFDDDDDVPDEINIDYQRVKMKEFYVVEDATAHTNYLPHFEAATMYNSYPYYVPKVEHILPQSELFELIDTEYYETSTKFVMKFTINVHTDLFDPNAKNFWLGIELPSGYHDATIIDFNYLNHVAIPAGGKISGCTVLRNDDQILSFIWKSTQNWKVIYNKITKQLVIFIKGKFDVHVNSVIYSTKDMNHFRFYLVYGVDEITGSDDDATVYAIYPKIAYKNSVGNGTIEE